LYYIFTLPKNSRKINLFVWAFHETILSLDLLKLWKTLSNSDSRIFQHSNCCFRVLLWFEKIVKTCLFLCSWLLFSKRYLNYFKHFSINSFYLNLAKFSQISKLPNAKSLTDVVHLFTLCLSYLQASVFIQLLFWKKVYLKMFLWRRRREINWIKSLHLNLHVYRRNMECLKEVPLLFTFYTRPWIFGEISWYQCWWILACPLVTWLHQHPASLFQTLQFLSFT
jgi:hypothetical protein